MTEDRLVQQTAPDYLSDVLLKLMGGKVEV